MSQKLARFTTSSILELMMVSGALHNKELPMLTKAPERLCLAHLHHQIKDSTLRTQLTPTYDFGCKRPTFSNHYYPTFTRPNVELITDGINQITGDGIVACDGTKRKIDLLILATGYKVWEKGNFPAFDVFGSNGTELRSWWDRNRYQSYEGITIAGFPNLFYLASPFAFTGLSFFFTIEGQMKHMKRCLTAMQKRGASSFEIKKESQERFMEKMRDAYGSTVFVNGNCASSNSYYFNQHGESTMLRPTPTPVALWRTSHFRLNDYRYS